MTTPNIGLQYVQNNMPALDAVSITPSDSVDLTVPVRAIFANVAGTLNVITMGGTTISFTVTASQLLPVAVSRVKATGTTVTAGNIIGLI
jgi:hypothetical protein